MKSGSIDASWFVLLSQNWFGCLESLWFHTNFRTFYFSCEKCHWDFDRNCLEPTDGFQVLFIKLLLTLRSCFPCLPFHLLLFILYVLLSSPCLWPPPSSKPNPQGIQTIWLKSLGNIVQCKPHMGNIKCKIMQTTEIWMWKMPLIMNPTATQALNISQKSPFFKIFKALQQFCLCLFSFFIQVKKNLVSVLEASSIQTSPLISSCIMQSHPTLVLSLHNQRFCFVPG